MATNFLRTLQAVEGTSDYLVNGVVWSASSWAGDEKLTRNIDDAAGARVGHVSVQAAVHEEKGFVWSYYRHFTEKLMFTHSGYSSSVEEACAAALAFVPATMVLDYLGKSYTFYGVVFEGKEPRRWEADIDGDLCDVTGPFASGDKSCYCWEREWAEGEKLLSLCGGKLKGEKPTLRETMIAAVDAIELFKRGCGELIASLSRGQ